MFSWAIATTYFGIRKMTSQKFGDALGRFLVYRILGVAVMSWLGFVMGVTLTFVIREYAEVGPELQWVSFKDILLYFPVCFVAFWALNLIVGKIKDSRIPVFYIVRGLGAQFSSFVFNPLMSSLEKAIILALSSMLINSAVICLVVASLIFSAPSILGGFSDPNRRMIIFSLATVGFNFITLCCIFECGIVPGSIVMSSQNMVSALTGHRLMGRLEEEGMPYTVIEIGDGGEGEPTYRNQGGSFGA